MGRPFTFPYPVTTPSPGIFSPLKPKSWQLCSINELNSTNVPGSNNKSTRSLAVNFPFSCCLSTLPSPPPSRASNFRSYKSWIHRKYHFSPCSISFFSHNSIKTLPDEVGWIKAISAPPPPFLGC